MRTQRVRHVARLDRLCRRARLGQVDVEDVLAESLLHLVDAVVVGDLAVMVGTQRNDAGGTAPRQWPLDATVHDGVGPFAVDVDVVAGARRGPRRAHPDGRQPISLKRRPRGPKNHSMCVADVLDAQRA